MRYIILLVSAFLVTIIITSCSYSENEDSSDESRTISVEETIGKGLYEQVMAIGGDKLPVGEIERWVTMRDLIKEILILEQESKKPLDKQKKTITSLFEKYGFESYKDGIAEIERSGEMINFIMEIGIKIASVETIELTKGKKEATKANKEIIEALKKRGFSQADVKGLDEYENTIGKSIGLLFKLPKE